MVSQLAEKVYNPIEYLELDAAAQIRHEFIDGAIVPMAGGTTKHNLITGNIYLALRLALRGKNKPVYMENVRLWIPKANVFTYPDVMIIDGNPEYYSESETTVTNPAVIFEVLSDSTRDYDQGRKFGFYRSLESLQEYILVDQDRCLVMAYRRGKTKEWILHILESAMDVVSLESVGVTIKLEAIYEET